MRRRLSFYFLFFGGGGGGVWWREWKGRQGRGGEREVIMFMEQNLLSERELVKIFCRN